MRLMVIDDEEDIGETIAEIAETRGFEVQALTSPTQAAELIKTSAPDVIILDLMMPGTDGVELLRMLVEFIKNTKIILMSGSDTRVLNSARRLGSAHGLEVISTLEKPINIETLRTLLDQLSAGRSSQEPSADIAQALATGQIILYYQPIIDIATRRVKGVEALARWAHSTRGILPPSEFLDCVSEEGLMPAMTEMALDTAIKQAARWHQAGEDLTVSINVTASSLLELNLPDHISDLCAAQQLPTDKVILEVTEAEAMRDVKRTMDVLLRMRIRNIGVSIDDFGTGHSSLRELQRMPFSQMKIDKSFVIDMVNNKDCAVIVNSVIDLGHNLGLKTVAEGVEDVRIWRMLADHNCDYAQGFYMAKPMPAEEFNRWMHSWREASPEEPPKEEGQAHEDKPSPLISKQELQD